MKLFDSVEAKPHPVLGVGTQRMYEFTNGWGASVIHGTIAQPHGGYELAVTEGLGGALNYDFTDGGVVPNLTKSQVEKWLTRISYLPPRHDLIVPIGTRLRHLIQTFWVKVLIRSGK